MNEQFPWYGEKWAHIVATILSVSLLEDGNELGILTVCRDFQVFPQVSYDGVEYIYKPPITSQNNFYLFVPGDFQ